MSEINIEELSREELVALRNKLRAKEAPLPKRLGKSLATMRLSTRQVAQAGKNGLKSAWENFKAGYREVIPARVEEETTLDVSSFTEKDRFALVTRLQKEGLSE